MAENFIFCSRCGAQNPDNASFCRTCGTGLGTNLPAAAPAAPVPAYAPINASAGYGGFWIRFVAWIVDTIILSLASFPIRMMFHFPRYGFGPFDGGHGGLPFFLIPGFFGASLVINWLYEALMLSSSWEATLGKKMLNLRVTDDAGNRLTFLHATGRHFAKYVSNLTLGIGYIMAGFTERHRALHDMLAGTVVRKD